MISCNVKSFLLESRSASSILTDPVDSVSCLGTYALPDQFPVLHKCHMPRDAMLTLFTMDPQYVVWFKIVHLCFKLSISASASQ